MFSQKQIEVLFLVGTSLIGEKFNGMNCVDFVNKIYETADIPFELKNSPTFSFSEVFEKKAIGYPIFLHRKKTKIFKRITHIGIIFPNYFILHYSRWMNGEPGFYEVSLSPFKEVFKIYDFVEVN